MSGRFKFTEEEILQKLGELGYQNVPKDKLAQFAKGIKISIQFSGFSLGKKTLV